MAGRRFPLDGAFAELREVVEQVTRALGELKATIGNLAKQGSSGARTAGGREAGELGGAAGRASQGVNQLAASQERGARAARDFAGQIRRSKGEVDGLQQSLRSAGQIAKLLGLEEASRGLDQVAQGLGAVKDLVYGLVQAGPALVSVATAAAVLVVGLGAIQKGVQAATGETLSLSNTIGATVLAITRQAVGLVAEIRVAFQTLPEIVRIIFLDLAQTIVAGFGRVLIIVNQLLVGIGNEILKMPEAARAAIPGLTTLGEAMLGLGHAAAAAAKDAQAEFEALGETSQEVAKRIALANKEVRKEAGELREGVDRQINDLFDAPEGKGLFDDPLGAMREFGDDLKNTLGQKTEEGAKEAAKELDAPKVQTQAFSSGTSVGESWNSGVSEALGSVKLDEAIVDALLVDPDDETKVINSFKDLLTNLKNLFRSNPIGFIGGFLGLAGGGFSPGFAPAPAEQAPAGMAYGGMVRGGGAASFAHFVRPQGLARGGRPRGLHPTDVVPIWAALGEFMVNARAVARPFVLPALEAINTGRADPLAVRAVASGAPSVPAVPAGPGYASGGRIAPRGGGGSSGPIRAYIPPDPTSLRALLKGGQAALYEALREAQADGVIPK